MSSWNRNRVLRFFAGIVLAGMLPLASLQATESKTVSAVEVEEGKEGVTRIILRGADDPIYTAFMREEPPRLIVEMPDVVFDGVSTPIRVENGVVNQVTLGAFGDPRVALSMARVSIGLDRNSEYELLPNGDELIIEIRPKQAPAGSPVTVVEESEPQAQEAPPASPAREPEVAEPQDTEVENPVAEQGAADAEGSTPEAEQAAEPTTPEVSRILEVTPVDGSISIIADGPIDNIDSFTLEEPYRLVVDFFGARSGVSARKMKVSDGVIEGVRIGEHADKVRVVFDLSGPLAGHKLMPDARGVTIRLEAAELAEAPANEAQDQSESADAQEPAADPSASWETSSQQPAAPDRTSGDAEETATETQEQAADVQGAAAEVQEDTVVEVPAAASDSEAAASSDAPATWPQEEQTPATAPGAPVTVESVHFEALPGFDRVVVTLSDAVEAGRVEPDQATIIITLPGVTIAPDSERRVETKEFEGPVEMFSVFQTPDVAYDEVRVVLKRRGDGTASLQWDAAQLRIELPRDAVVGQPTDSEGGTYTPAATPTSDGSGQPGQMATASEATELAPSEPVAVPTMPMAGEMAAAQPELATPGGPAPASLGEEALGQGFEGDELFNGPADPASIDVLEEGGFSDEKAYSGRRVSLDFKDADIANILRLIAEVSDLNVIAGEEVAGKVTIRLVDVPWDQALDVILLTKGLGFVRVGNVLRIAPLETLKLESEQRLQERRAKEKLEDLVVKLQPVNFGNVGEISSMIKRLLSARGSVNVDKRTNTVIIKDIPSVVHEATALIKAIDTQTPQVMIEAKIVEATLGFSRGLGAWWAAEYRPGSNPGGGQDFHLADDTLDAAHGGDFSQITNFVSRNPVAGALTGILNLGILAIEDQIQLDLQMQAMEATNKGKVISSPRVVTLDNREAVIKQGVAIKFESATRDRITISFVDAVLELKVTPHITANRSIIMAIKVSRNAPNVSDATGDIVGINKNETETEALVRDGETIVLGGIYVVDTGTSTTKTPFLADIPLLGTAFRSNTVADERRELLVFVTPRIVLGAPEADL
jgi:type IV pilus assembly protein PilQ